MIEPNDLIFITERYGAPLAGQAAPRNSDGQINPHVSRFLLGDKETFVDVFHVKPIYYLHKNGQWRPMSEVTSHLGVQDIVLNKNWKNIDHFFFLYLMERSRELGSELLIDYGPLAFGMQPRHMAWANSLTVMPVPGTTVDGYMYHVGTGGTGQANWTTSRNAANCNTGGGGAADYTSATGYNTLALNDSGYNRCDISRYGALFDTSSLGATAVISAAVFSQWLISWNNSGGNTGANASVGLYSFSPASQTVLGTNDYAAFGSTLFSNTNLNMYAGPTTGYNDLTLNSTGIAAIAKTGISGFGCRNGWDISNTVPPTTTNFGGGQDQNNAYTAKQTGTANDPKLVVTYSLPSPAHGAFLLNLMN